MTLFYYYSCLATVPYNPRMCDARNTSLFQLPIESILTNILYKTMPQLIIYFVKSLDNGRSLIGLRLFIFYLRCLGHLRLKIVFSFSQLGFNPVVAPFFEFEGQFRAGCLHDAAFVEYVHDVGLDVVEQTLVVGDDDA